MRRFWIVICLSWVWWSYLSAWSPVAARTTSVQVGSPAAVIAATPAPSPLPSASPAPLNLSLTPVTLTLETAPGTPVTTPIRIRNNSQTAESLAISFGTFTADATGARPQLRDPLPSDQFMKWLSVDQPNFTLGANEWKTINVTFTPPPEAALTYYYTLIFNRESSGAVPGQTSIQGAPAMLVLTNVVSAHARRELQLSSFQATSPIVEFLPQSFTVTIKNSGNVHAAPAGTIFIDGQGREDLAVLAVNPGGNMVLPDSSRTLTVNWSDGFPRRNEAGELDWNLSDLTKLRFGKYTAQLILVYDNGERDVPLEAFVSFWVIPWRLLLAVIAIPVLPAILVFVLMRQLYRRKQQP